MEQKALETSEMMPQEEETPPTNSPSNRPPFWTWRSVRFQMAFLLAAGMMMQGIIRGSLGMALVCMIRASPLMPAQSTTPSLSMDNPAALTKLAPGNTSANVNYNTDLQVEWDATAVSFMHTAFYIGTIFSVFFAQRCCQTVGAKRLIAIGIIVNVLCTWSIPLAVYLCPHHLLMSALRFITGISQGMFIPCASLLIAKWYADDEKCTAMAIFTTGNQVGIAAAMYSTAEFCRLSFLAGWPNSFLSYGCLGVAFLFVWLPLAADRPRHCARITKAELDHIDGVDGERRRAVSTVIRTPYVSMLRSPAVLALCASSFCQSYVIVAMISYLPEFYRTALRLDISVNGKWSALPFFIQIFSKIIFAFLADYMKRSGSGSVTAVTKLFDGIASFGCAACLLAVSFSEVATVKLVLLSVGLALTSGYVPGYNTSIVCVAPAFTAAISAYAQGFAVVAGVVSPIVNGILIKQGGDNAWNIVFQTWVLVLVATGLAFQLFGSANVQRWAVLSSGQPPSMSPPKSTLSSLLPSLKKRHGGGAGDGGRTGAGGKGIKSASTRPLISATNSAADNNAVILIEPSCGAQKPKRVQRVSVMDEHAGGAVFLTRDDDAANNDGGGGAAESAVTDCVNPVDEELVEELTKANP